MSIGFLFWIYLSNLVLLINHEIDSAYWEEWNLFNLKKNFGIQGFVIIHIPVLFLFIYGLILINEGSIYGLILSVLLSLSGIFAFFFHFYHLRKGRPEFSNIVSKSILVGTFVASVFQIVITFGLIL